MMDMTNSFRYRVVYRGKSCIGIWVFGQGQWLIGAEWLNDSDLDSIGVCLF